MWANLTLKMKIKLFTIPNCITLLNLSCGVASIIASLVYGDLRLAFAFVAASAVFDFMDGMAARLLGQYSAVGVELDSLADMVSFGVAPAVALYAASEGMPLLWDEGVWGEVLRYVPLLIPAFSALRLAKFNIDDTQKEEFEGLPTPASAILLLSTAAICERYSLIVDMEWFVLLSLITAAMLISPVRMFSLKFHEWGLGSTDNKIRYGFLITSCLLICLLRLYAIPTIIVLYIAVSAVRWIVKK